MIITGTSKGIGRKLCEYYLSKNYIVAGCSRKSVNFENNNYQHYSLDVSEEKAIISMVKDIYKKYSKIDYLINNAGIASMNHFLLTPLKTAHNIFNTNYFISFIFMREVAKIMMRQKNGRIVNYSTVAVPLNLDGEAIYASSKCAIEQLTKITAKELGEFNITINAIGPTPIQTDLIKNVPEKKINELINRQAIKRFGTFEDIKNVVDFYLNENSDFITGQTIYLGGIFK